MGQIDLFSFFGKYKTNLKKLNTCARLFEVWILGLVPDIPFNPLLLKSRDFKKVARKFGRDLISH